MNYGKRKLPSTSMSTDDGGHLEGMSDDTVKRKFRNMNEKKRRDQFNMLINELSAIVCSSDTKRVDKTTVLEQAIQFLEHHQASETTQNENISYSWKPSFLSPDEFSYLLLEALDCVTLALDELGSIKYMSDNAYQKLGLAQDVVDMSKKLQDFLADSKVVDTLIDNINSRKEKLARVETLLTCGSMNEDRKYQIIDLLCIPEGDTNSSMRHTSSASSPSSSPTSPYYSIYNCIIQLKMPALSKDCNGPRDMSFKGKYSLEWKILHIENKAASVLGYQPFEILGSSGYDFYHPQDIDHIAAAHRKLIRSGCCKTPLYRMLTKSQNWVWLQSNFYMCYNQWSSKPEHIEGMHQVVSKEEVEAFIKSGCQLEQQAASPVEGHGRSKKNKPNYSRPSSEAAAKSHHVIKKDVFSSQLADIGINRNREIKFGRRPQEHYLDASSRSISTLSPPLLTPKHLTPAQTKLHMQLQNKYKDLRANLEKQQAELADLLQQLNLAAMMKPSSPNSPVSSNMNAQYSQPSDPVTTSSYERQASYTTPSDNHKHPRNQSSMNSSRSNGFPQNQLLDNPLILAAGGNGIHRSQFHEGASEQNANECTQQ